MTDIKQDVAQFYNQVGWQLLEGGSYQNTRYEDLRPVSREYIHRCHLRVNRYLKQHGRLLLDAGSGPVQYPEYLSYSQGYKHRVCLDISIVALQEARKRLGDHGLYVVADVSNLPFVENAFDGVVSLHTLHHLPADDQKKAYFDFYRVLTGQSTAVVVNGWTDSTLMRVAQPLVRAAEALGKQVSRLRGRSISSPVTNTAGNNPKTSTGTYIQKIDSAWLGGQLNAHMKFKIWVWRSVNVRFLRALVHAPLGGRYWLRLLYFLEDLFPRYFGEKGQYPLIVVSKEVSR